MKAFPYNSVLDEVSSTNDCARAMGEEGAPHGSWISARRQVGGRGRLGREWRSFEGNLFLSVVLRPPLGFPMTWIPLSVALCVYDTANEYREDVDLVLKWPNDLGLRDRKLGFRKAGGILCEGFGNSAGSFVVAGIGVNCAIAPETDQPTAALGVNVDRFREKLMDRLGRVFLRSIAEIRSDYTAASLLRSGDPISWRDLRFSVNEVESQGSFEGYGENGELLVKVEGGEEIRHLYSEEVKLRMR